MKLRDNNTEIRPWGEFTILSESSDYKIKKIKINPGQRFSYQYHNKRSEVWVVLKGKLSVTLDDKEYLIKESESITIPVKSKHRAQNKTKSEAYFIEVQTGESFNESDIVRLEDDYNRL